MRRSTLRAVVISLFAIGSAVLQATPAQAGTGYEFPENGTEQLGRAGAWVARASNPLATYFNAAGLAGQQSAVLLNVNLIWQKNCFDRRDSSGNVATFQNGTFRYPAEVCNTDSGTPFPNPQIALTLRINDKLGIGFGVMGPSTRGQFSYPEVAPGSYLTLNNKPGNYASPQRYLLLNDNLLFVWPQIGFGYEVIPNLRIGGSFIWGIAQMKFATNAAGLSGQGTTNADDQFDSDVSAELTVRDWFVPGFTAGALASPHPWVDVALWYQWMDSIKAKGDATIRGPMYEANGKLSDPSTRTVTTTTGDKAGLTAPWPMQARAGIRLHQPRNEARPATDHAPPTGTPQFRDPIANDRWDLELDVTWANNSQFKSLDVTFAPNTYASIRDVTHPGSQISIAMPENASVPHYWKDAFGFRLGGDYVVIPSKIAVRAGAFYQGEAQDPRYLHLDYVPSQMFGLNAGATYRVGPFDLMVGFSHVFFKGLDNGGNGATQALAGSAPYRTVQAVNGGSNSSSVTIASLGASYRF